MHTQLAPNINLRRGAVVVVGLFFVEASCCSPLSSPLTSFSWHALMAWTASNHPFLQNCRSRTRTHRPHCISSGNLQADNHVNGHPSRLAFGVAHIGICSPLLRLVINPNLRRQEVEGGERLSESLSLNTNFLPSLSRSLHRIFQVHDDDASLPSSVSPFRDCVTVRRK